MAQKIAGEEEGGTVEVPRSLLEKLLTKVESLESRLQASEEERKRQRPG